MTAETVVDNNAERQSQEEVFKSYEELREDGRIEFITFHPSYSYEEFVEGICARTIDDKVVYEIEDGVFKCLSIRAEEEYDRAMEEGRKPNKYVLIIDEINRGNIPKIFGELITLIEADKRKGEKNQIYTILPYTKSEFCVPPNLYVIGTMNTADTSIALIDVALRRRFSFVERTPNYEVLRENLGFSNTAEVDNQAASDNLKALSVKALEVINQRIKLNERLGRDKRIGHSYLWDIDNGEKAVMAWQYDILPLLQEYLYGRYDEMIDILNDEGLLIDHEGQRIKNFSPDELRKGLHKIILAD